MNRATRTLATLAVTALAIVGWAVPAAVATWTPAPAPSNPESPAYWEAEYDNAVACYYSEGQTSHGRVTQDLSGAKGVKLATFQQSWPGDRWEVLIVGGKDDFREYPTPDAGTLYAAPEGSSVEYWIVCKGETPDETDEFNKYTTYVCWEITSTDYTLENGQPVINREWFSPEQEFVSEADSFEGLQDCWDYVADCDTPTTWYQLDQYVVRTEADHALLERLKAEGLGWDEGPEDSPIVESARIHSVTGAECQKPPPPTEDICVWDADEGVAVQTSVTSVGKDDIPWVDGSECTPPVVTICAQDGDTWYGQPIFENELTADDIVWTGNPEDCYITPPSLEGTAAVGICVDGVPRLEYTIRLTDPDSQISDAAKQGATVTFLHPTDPSQDHVIDLGLDDTLTEWNGSVLWPGASVDPAAWPGWDELMPGVFVPVGDDNFGWTRDGVSVEVALDPELSFVEVLYPDSDPVCDTPPPVDICLWDGSNSHQTTIYGDLPEGAIPWNPDVVGGGCAVADDDGSDDEDEDDEDEFTIVLGAPPLEAPAATPVVAEAAYTG